MPTRSSRSLRFGVRGLAVAGVLRGAIAERRHPFHDALARHILRAVADFQDVAREHDFGGRDAGAPGERVLDQPAARVAPHPADMKNRLGCLRVGYDRPLACPLRAIGNQS